jgi:hypothetical protein
VLTAQLQTPQCGGVLAKVKKVAEQFHEQQKEQSRHDGSPPHQWEGKQQVIQEGDNKKDEEMSFQKAKRVLKAIYGYSNSDSSIGEHHKKLHVMYGGPWDITSRYLIRTLSQAVAAAAPAPRVVSYHKWMEMSIVFNASNCSKNMAGARKLPLVIYPTIANVRLYHVPIDGRAALNLISLAAFQKQQIPMSKLTLSHLLLGMGSGCIIPHNSISHPVT